MTKCIKCGSKNVTVKKQGVGGLWLLIGLLFFFPLMLLGIIGSKKTTIKCKKCKYTQVL